ncbi:MAG TPA: zf-HC2 domain-containing protein [Anaerolineaceae bacterium]|nr:zf-HC2 domain-containing protein [Anaerolineaceae bacterium]
MSEHIHTPQCQQILGSLSEYIDGELQAELCAEIEAHLKDCNNCRIVVNTLRKTVELYEQTQPQPELPEGVRERLFLKLDLDDFLQKNNKSSEI